MRRLKGANVDVVFGTKMICLTSLRPDTRKKAKTCGFGVLEDSTIKDRNGWTLL